jgi:hypothetical protein
MHDYINSSFHLLQEVVSEGSGTIKKYLAENGPQFYKDRDIFSNAK